ncbi:tight adherence protein B [Lachnospiraceae bacterium NK3A20]|jgi:tight adherence protein B|nr:tight adherence protein B [Lachnospiraceae bacterium NK3A20]
MGSVMVVLITLMAGGTAALCCTALLYNPDKTVVRKQVRDMYHESDKESFFASLMKEKEQRTVRRTFKVSRRFEKEFETAGIDMPAGEFLAVWALSAILPLVLVNALTGKAVVAGGFCAVGFLAPLIFFKKKQIDRRNAFNGQFADVLLTICNGLKSGFSFQQSLASITKDMQPPVSIEFGKAVAEMEYGVSQHDALMHIYDRVRCEDMKMLVSALDIAKKTGGNLSDVLETISETVRTRIKIRQEVKALSAQGKTSALIIGALPIVLMILLSILNPEYIGQLFQTPLGQKMLIVAAIMETVGFTVMNKITDVKL